MGPELISFFIVLVAGIFFSVIFARLHLPWVVALIIGGIIIGPHVLGIFTPNPTIEFLGSIGLIFLMFMAGLQTRLGSVRALRHDIVIITLLNGGIPMLVGLGIGWYFDYSMTTALLLGVIFISSSIAVIIPALEANGLMRTRTGQSILATTIVQDILSLVLLSILLQTTSPVTSLPLPLFYILLFGAIIALRWVIVHVRTFFKRYASGMQDFFQQEVRSVFVILIGTVVAFELLGLHPIIGGFFAGLVLSGTIASDVLKGKLRALSYGLFIPIFFVIIGTQANIGAFANANGKALILTAVIIVGSLSSKFISGFLAGLLTKHSVKESELIGIATTPQLSTTLAVASTGLAFGLLDGPLTTALVILSIVTTLLGPFLMKVVSPQITQNKP